MLLNILVYPMPYYCLPFKSVIYHWKALFSSTCISCRQYLGAAALRIPPIVYHEAMVPTLQHPNNGYFVHLGNTCPQQARQQPVTKPGVS